MLSGSNDNNISKLYFSSIQLLQNIFHNSLYFFNNYHLLYLKALNQYMTDNTNNFSQSKSFQWADATSFISSLSYFLNKCMNKWLEATDEEANRILKSQQFIDNFREYMKSIIKYEILLKEESNNNPFFSINDLDKITDKFQDYFNKEFISFIFNQQAPHNIVLQIDTFRLLNYNILINNKFRKSELKVNSQQQKQQKINQDNIPSSLQLTPLLIVYAPINRYHVLDINQKRSIVKQFLSKGFDVFLIDWGSQNTEQIDITNKNAKLIEDYISFIDKSINKIKELTKSNTVNLYGYSWGGLLCTLYTSFQNSNKNIQNLILHSSPLDFSKDNTIIAEWLRKFPTDDYIEQYKQMHGSLIDISFLMRNPFKHNFDSLRYALAMQIDTNTINSNSILNSIQGNYQNIDFMQLLADIIRLRTWITNTPDLPGGLFNQFVEYFYCKNTIITNQNKNEIHISPKLTNENRNTYTNTVYSKNLNEDNNNKSYFPSMEKIIEDMNLTRITMPTLSIVGKTDDLIPYDSSISINNYISTSDKDLIEFSGDHIELCISYNAHTEIWPKVVKWLVQRS